MAKGSVGGANPEFILREFQGMNVFDERENINDNEFYWCENAIPVASGALYPLPGISPAALATVAGESGAPTYVINFTENLTTFLFPSQSTDFIFAVWANSGNGWIINLTNFATTKIITGLTSGQTAATQYSNQGLLIIDPTGYWDWNITAPNTLTPQNGSLANATLVTALTLQMGSSLRQLFTPATGTGGAYQNDYEVTTVTVNGHGTGYAVGDTITLTDGNPTAAASIVVASIGSGGTITGITLSSGGNYPGPTSTTLVQVGPSGTATATTGGGTGATFQGVMMAFQAVILTNGHGYPSSTTGADQFAQGSGFANGTTNTITSSGVIGGTGIATYQGHVWIASGRTVFFTDTDSFNSFGGVGGSFFISDAYLHNIITALFSANNYLYIFGDDSIDALSNVTVAITNGVALLSFSRINVTASVGTSTPTSVFAYYRAVVFYHSSGFYLLAGATPERISDKISGIVNQITQSVFGAIPHPLVYSGQVLIESELCAAFQFIFSDIFTQGGTTRNITAMFFRGRWFVSSFPGAGAPTIVSISRNGNATLFAWINNQLFQLFSPAAITSQWLLKTKFWDGGAPVMEKQSLNAALGANWAALPATGVTVNVDTELSTQPAVQSPLAGAPGSYDLEVTAANEGGSQYLGMTVTGSTDVTKIRMLALRGKTDAHDFLQ